MEWIQKHSLFLKRIGIIAGVYLGMKYLVPLVFPFLTAFLAVAWCQPVLKWGRRRLHLKPVCTMAILILLVLFLAVGGFYTGGRKVCDEVEEFSCDFQLQREAQQLAGFVKEQVSQELLPGAVGGTWQLAKGFGGAVTACLVSLISMLLLASDWEKLERYGKGKRIYENAAEMISRLLKSVGGYLKAQGILLAAIILICITGIFLSNQACGSSKNPVWEGIFVGLLDALPVFGSGTVFLPWLLFQIYQKEYVSALILAGTYGLCVLARELLEPKLVGNRLGVLPIVILASVYVGVKLYGLGGIIKGPLSVLLIRELWSFP